jgi:hypothetical protein
MEGVHGSIVGSSLASAASICIGSKRLDCSKVLQLTRLPGRPQPFGPPSIQAWKLHWFFANS